MVTLRKQFPKLMESFELKHLKLKNRLVKAAQWTVFAEADGSVSQRLLNFYESLARGGVGLITVEESVYDYPAGASNERHLRLDDDRFLPGLTQLATVIHRHDCPAVVQMTHAGPAHNPQVSGAPPVAPSRMDPPAEPVFAVARELSVAEIEALIEKFALAALRVKKAGFDGIEVHMAHYALGNAFLSRIQNHRDDQYGAGSLENRARFGTSILRAVREICGDRFIIGVRMNGREWGHERGTTTEEARVFAGLFEAAGADYLQVSAYGYGPFALNALPELVSYPETPPEAAEFVRTIRQGALLGDARLIREAVNIPVSGVGHLDPEAAEEALESGGVDLIALGRPLLVDPDLPRKIKTGVPDQIRPCLRCNVCLSDILLGRPATCRLNAFMGNEGEMRLNPVDRPRRVIVVGAGPAGMEAARVAAERGHHVSLYDREAQPGGLMPMAAFIKGFVELDDLTKATRYYRRELHRLDVELHTGIEISANLIELLDPDAVVLATGGVPEPVRIPGADLPYVMTTEDLKQLVRPFLHLFGSRLMAKLSKVYLPEIGHRVLVVGGDLAGLETAEFLIKRGREVVVTEAGEQPGAGMPLAWLVRLLPWLAAKGARVLTKTTVERFESGGVVTLNVAGKTEQDRFDSVIVITRYRANDFLFNHLRSLGMEVYRVGDAAGELPGLIQGAVLAGARAGLSL